MSCLLIVLWAAHEQHSFTDICSPQRVPTVTLLVELTSFICIQQTH